MLVPVWQVGAVLLALDSQSSAFRLLEALQAQVGSLSSDASGREAAGSVPDSVMEGEPSPDSSSTSHTAHRLSTTPTSIIYYSTANTKNSVLGSLFELGLSDIERQETMNKYADSPLHDILKDLKNVSSIPLAPLDDSFSVDDDDAEVRIAVLQYLDGIRKDAWAQFRSMALGYIEFLEQEYEDQKLTDRLRLDLIKKILDLGDKANFLHVAGKKMDPELAEYLLGQLQPLFSQFDHMNGSSILSESVSSIINGFVRDSAWESLHHFVSHVLRVAEIYVSREELEEYMTELASSIPIAAKGLDLIMNGPPKSSGSVGGRSLGNWLGYGDYNSGYGGGGYDDSYGAYSSYNREGYGGYGAHGDSYGTSSYSYGIYLDPYLVLAGIGAAALLSFLAHKVFMITKPPKKRRRSDAGLALTDLSDMPGVVSSIHSMLEAAGDKYESKRSLPAQLDDLDDLIQGLNSLWREHKSDSGCLRCSVFTFTANHAHASYNLLKGLTL